MGLKWIRDGKVIDNGESGEDANSADGRTYLPYTNAAYLQDGSVIATSDRVDIGGNKLPPSGNISQVLKKEASDPKNTDLQYLAAARAAGDADAAAQKARMDSAIASATNLVQTSSVPGTNNGTWVVKPTQNQG